MLIAIGAVFVVLGLIVLITSFEKDVVSLIGGIIVLIICLGLSAAIIFGYPNYMVWEQGKQGEAALAKATQDRQIKVQEAEAEQEAASKQAEANRILGESVREYPEAMEQKWVEAIANTSNQVIYLPTEASVPITESGRMAMKRQEEKEKK